MKNGKKAMAWALALMLMVFVKVSYGQSVEDATNAYNQGVALASTDLAKAVEQLIQAADIATKAGEAGNDIKKLAESQIPMLQYNYATSLYKDKKLDESIANFIHAREYAVKYNDDGIKAKTTDLLPKLYFSKGNSDLKDGKNESALDNFDKSIEFDSTFAKGYLGKGLVYKKMDKFAEMKSTLDKAIETGNKTADEKSVATAQKLMADEYLRNANDAFKKGNNNEVVAQLDESMKYVDSNVEVFYLYALAYNKMSKFDEALTSCEKGLALEENTPAKQARFYFEMGIAQSGKGDNGTACSSFKKAAIGPLAESANYQIKTVLKCS